MLNRAASDIYFNSSLQISTACNRIIELTDNENDTLAPSVTIAEVKSQLEIVEHQLLKLKLLTTELEKRLQAEHQLTV